VSICVLVLFFASLALGLTAQAAKEPPQATGWAVDAKTQVPAKAPAKVETAEDTMAPLRKADRLTHREARQIGITFRNVRRILRDLQAEGVLDVDDAAGTSLQVMGRLQNENPKAFASVGTTGDRDWGAFLDAVIAFLEKFIPMLIKFMSIFGFVL